MVITGERSSLMYGGELLAFKGSLLVDGNECMVFVNPLSTVLRYVAGYYSGSLSVLTAITLLLETTFISVTRLFV